MIFAPFGSDVKFSQQNFSFAAVVGNQEGLHFKGTKIAFDFSAECREGDAGLCGGAGGLDRTDDPSRTVFCTLESGHSNAAGNFHAAITQRKSSFVIILEDIDGLSVELFSCTGNDTEIVTASPTEIAPSQLGLGGRA